MVRVPLVSRASRSIVVPHLAGGEAEIETVAVNSVAAAATALTAALASATAESGFAGTQAWGFSAGPSGLPVERLGGGVVLGHVTGSLQSGQGLRGERVSDHSAGASRYRL